MSSTKSSRWQKAKDRKLSAGDLHTLVPPDWYFRSIKENFFQRFWHTTRHREIKKIIEEVRGGKILDIGCADGVFTREILRKTRAAKIIGIDVVPSSLRWARKHWGGQKKMRFRLGDAHKLKFGDREFDAVFALEVLEHVFEPEKVLQEVKRVLKEDGYAILLVPSESKLFKIVWFLWHYMGRMVWKDTHIQDFKKDSLIKLCKDMGFRVETNHKFILGMLQAIKVRKK